MGVNYPVQIFILKMVKIRPKERKWKLGAKLDLRPRCPDSQLRPLCHTLPLQNTEFMGVERLRKEKEKKA